MNIRPIVIAGVVAAASWIAAVAHAQYPVKPVRYVVAFPPGDGPDISARLVGDRLGKLWEQQVLVENRVGAGGTIAAAFVAKAPADGYTLFHCNIASNAWYGMCTPAGTPSPVLNKLHADLMRTLQAPELQQRLADLVIDVAPTSREEFVAFVRSELDRWAKVVKDAGVPRQ